MVYSKLLKLSLDYNPLVRDLKANTRPNKILGIDKNDASYKAWKDFEYHSNESLRKQM